MAYLWRLLLPPSHKEQMTEHVWQTENTGNTRLGGSPPTPATPTEEETPSPCLWCGADHR